MSSKKGAEECAELATTHYELYRPYLDVQNVSNASSSSRASARDKLQRMANQDFINMSIDVYDELNRRQVNSPDIPFLPVRHDLAPQKNGARQKLATLPISRFHLLCSDIMCEIEYRFPIASQRYASKFGTNANRGRSMEAPKGRYENSGRSDAKNYSTPLPIPRTTRQKSQDKSYNQRVPPSPSGPRQNRVLSTMSTDQNKQSLDNLMNDLGSMMGPSSARRNDAVGMDAMKLEYEREIEELRNALAQVDQDALNMRIDSLEIENKKLTKDKAEVEALLSKVTTDYSLLKEDHENLLDDYEGQKVMASDIRTEASNLLEEIKSLQQTNEKLQSENDRLNGNRGGSKAPKDSGINDIDSPQISKSNNNATQDIVITQERIDEYQSSMSNFFNAADSDENTRILIAMKGVVLACKAITEDAESVTLEVQREDEMFRLKDRLSDCLGGLMSVAKAHSNGKKDPALLETPASDLTNAVFDLIDFLNLPAANSLNNGDGGNDVMSIDELKGYLENQTDQIVQAIQSLLLAMRNSVDFGTDFLKIVKEITTLVDDIVYFTRKALEYNPGLEEYVKNDGEAIVLDLQSSGSELKDLGDDMVNGEQSKSLKQKLASSSYEIAKFVKELVNLFE